MSARPAAPKAASQGTSDGPAAFPAPAVRSDRPRGPLPSPEQLLNLVHRTSSRTLTVPEAELLLNGVQHLLAQVAGAGATVRQATAALKVARSERNAALMELALTGPLAVGCSFCGVPAGQRCRSVRGALPPRTPHTARLHAAARASEKR
jgi:hypothetical protein